MKKVIKNIKRKEIKKIKRSAKENKEKTKVDEESKEEIIKKIQTEAEAVSCGEVEKWRLRSQPQPS